MDLHCCTKKATHTNILVEIVLHYKTSSNHLPLQDTFPSTFIPFISLPSHVTVFPIEDTFCQTFYFLNLWHYCMHYLFIYNRNLLSATFISVTMLQYQLRYNSSLNELRGTKLNKRQLRTTPMDSNRLCSKSSPQPTTLPQNRARERRPNSETTN